MIAVELPAIARTESLEWWCVDEAVVRMCKCCAFKLLSL